jgi:hypothetical protein
MSNIGPPNWWLRDKMIELTDKTLNVIDNAEKRLNTRIDHINSYRINKTISLTNTEEINITITIIGLNIIRISALRIINSGQSNESIVFDTMSLFNLFTEKLYLSIKENPDTFAMSFSNILDIQNYNTNKDNIKITDNKNIIKDINIDLDSGTGIVEIYFSSNIISEAIVDSTDDSETIIVFNSICYIEQILPALIEI